MTHRDIACSIGQTAETWRGVHALSKAAVMPYGRHKGRLITAAPSDYKASLLRQPAVDPHLLQALGALIHHKAPQRRPTP